jgi:hypothetical protein
MQRMNLAAIILATLSVPVADKTQAAGGRGVRDDAAAFAACIQYPLSRADRSQNFRAH